MYAAYNFNTIQFAVRSIEFQLIHNVEHGIIARLFIPNELRGTGSIKSRSQVKILHDSDLKGSSRSGRTVEFKAPITEYERLFGLYGANSNMAPNRVRTIRLLNELKSLAPAPVTIADPWETPEIEVPQSWRIPSIETEDPWQDEAQSQVPILVELCDQIKEQAKEAIACLASRQEQLDRMADEAVEKYPVLETTPSLEVMTKKQLVEIAKSRSIKTTGMTKKQLIAALD